MKLRFFGKEKEPVTLTGDEALSELGINIATGIQLNDRLESINSILDKIKSHKLDDDPIQRVKLMSEIVEKSIIPYGKGRETPAFARLVNAWSRIVTFFYQICRYPDIYEKYKKTINSMTLKELYEPFIVILTVGFSKEDLSKNIVSVIQTLVLKEGIQPLDSSIVIGEKHE